MDIAELTDETLKALAYEQIKLVQASQNNITLIERELQRRAAEKEVVVTEQVSN